MPTVDKLRALAAEADAEVAQLEKARDEALALVEAQISLAREHAARLRQMVDEVISAATRRELHKTPVNARVNSRKMHAQHKLRISEGQAKRDKDFKETIRNAKPGYTQASIATAVGMQASLLSMCRSGERAMFLSRAKRIEQLTGWPADKAHWPGGIIEDA